MHTRLFCYLLLLAVLASTSLSSCEEILDAEGLPYEEKLVIHSILFADSTENIIQITRTMPLNVPFDTTQAYLRDAVGSVSDDLNTYPLEYVGNSGKYRIKGLTPTMGKRYSLRVDWRGLSAEAVTEVPNGASIDSAWLVNEVSPFGDEQKVLYTVTSLPPGASALPAFYAEGLDPFYGEWMSKDVGYQLYDDRDKGADGKIQTRLTARWFSGSSAPSLIRALAFIFAPGYDEYHRSRRNESEESLGNPVVVKWNVHGDAIGIFFGCVILNKRIS